MSRFRILALIATAAVLTVGFTACGSGGGGGEDAQTVLEDATLSGVESGDIDLKLGIRSGTQGDLNVSLSGPFQAGAEGSLPQLDMTARVDGTSNGEPIDFAGGLTLLSDRAFIEYGGDVYEVDPTSFNLLRSGFEQSLRESGTEAGESPPTACQNAAKGLDVASFFENVKSEGGVDVGGTDTTKVSGDLDVEGALDEVLNLFEDPACSSTLGAVGPAQLNQLRSQESEVAGSIERAHAEVYVGEDHIVRKLVAQLKVNAEGESGELDLELTLGHVNEEQEITAPSGAQPLEGLFQQLGFNPLELLEGNDSSGLQGILEALEGGIGGLESGAGSVPEDSSNYLEYVECLQGAETTTDLQKCANLVE